MAGMRKWTLLALMAMLAVGVFGAAAPRAYAGNQGCTPGYWKQSQHFDSWPAPFTPSTTLKQAMGVTGTYANVTLLEALNFKGGSGVAGAAQILLRAAVAALLNAGTEAIDRNVLNYPAPYTVSFIGESVRYSLGKANRDQMLGLASRLDGYNNLGCPLN